MISRNWYNIMSSETTTNISFVTTPHSYFALSQLFLPKCDGSMICLAGNKWDSYHWQCTIDRYLSWVYLPWP